MSLSPGTHVAQYEIISPLGSGGMGEVYKARDSRLDREVAVKVMAPHIAMDPEMRRRFETEARAIAALSHPNIISIFELVAVDGLPAAVMELLEGRNLRDRLRDGPLPWRDAVQISAAVAEALAAAHAKGVIHRDLKPENVFLTSDGQVKILDFGLALQRLDSPAVSADGVTIARTSPGIVLGTFGYMSPEQVTGERVDGRSDIFAVGCLLYEMVRGERLFGGVTPQEMIANVLHDSVPDLSGFDPLAPKELRAILSRCIDRNPARRFEAAQDLAMALHALLTGSAAKTPRQGRSRGKSLAVLPFLNAGADPQLEYLTDGITESIINSLSQIGKLRVVPRSLAFRYKGLQADPATVGLALNARTILTGRVVQHGDVLNIQAELVDTVTESQLWGEQFRQKMSELITVQEEIAWQISEALRLKLTTHQRTKLRKRHTVNPEAYQEYLRGRYHWNNWTPDSFRRAIECFERAIALDPGYALPYAGLADAFGSMAYYGLIAPEDGFPRAKAAALRAIEIDPDLAEAHVSIALGRLFWEWNWPEAEREFAAALKLNPQLANAHALYALYLATVGRHEESVEEARTAQLLDPLSLLINLSVCWALHFARRYEETVRELVRARDLAPGIEEVGNMLTAAYEDLDRFEDAAATAGRQRCWGIPTDATALLDAYRSLGPEGYWRTRLAAFEQAGPSAARFIDYIQAVIYTRLGEIERAIESLERVVAGRMGVSVFMAVDGRLDPLRHHPRFQELLTKVGMPTASALHTASK
jgi:serine/threonine protein kinase/tetratricopeptide (TPR) repeat protein